MPRAVDRDTRRDELCDTVVDLAARDGFVAVTIRAIASVSGSSSSSVTHYVSGRDELIALAVRREIGRQQTRIGAARRGTGIDALRAVLAAAVLGTTERQQRLWMAIVAGARHDPVLARELDAFNAWWDDLIGEIVDELRVEPSVASRVADMTDVVTAGLITVTFEAPDHWQPERRERVLHALLDAIGSAHPSAPGPG